MLSEGRKLSSAFGPNPEYHKLQMHCKKKKNIIKPHRKMTTVYNEFRFSEDVNSLSLNDRSD